MPALERPVERVVQLRHDEPRHVAVAEREVGGLPRALELARDAEVERLGAQHVAEPARLLDARRR